VVCTWIGNSQQVAQKHYLQVTDDHYQRAVTAGAKSGAQVVHNPAQHLHVSARTGSQGTSTADEKKPLLPVHAPEFENLQGRGVGDTGGEPEASFPQKTGDGQGSLFVRYPVAWIENN
jgi:hypothetical protein